MLVLYPLTSFTFIDTSLEHIRSSHEQLPNAILTIGSNSGPFISLICHEISSTVYTSSTFCSLHFKSKVKLTSEQFHFPHSCVPLLNCIGFFGMQILLTLIDSSSLQPKGIFFTLGLNPRVAYTRLILGLFGGQRYHRMFPSLNH